MEKTRHDLQCWTWKIKKTTQNEIVESSSSVTFVPLNHQVLFISTSSPFIFVPLALILKSKRCDEGLTVSFRYISFMFLSLKLVTVQRFLLDTQTLKQICAKLLKINVSLNRNFFEITEKSAVTETRQKICWGLLTHLLPPLPHWACPWPGSAPSRPLAVVKRLMGDEPSVMRVDLSPRDWSIFTWRKQTSADSLKLSSKNRFKRFSGSSANNLDLF